MYKRARWFVVLVVSSLLLALLASCAPPAPTAAVEQKATPEKAAEEVLQVWITWGDNPA